MNSPVLMLAAFAALLLPAQASAQREAGAVDQIGPPSTSRGVEQIGVGTRELLAPPPAAREATAPGQLSGEAGRVAPQPQLTTEARSTPSAPQLYRGGRTALPSDPLSRPSEGRTGAVERVAGRDRCDPAEGSEAQRAACLRVIETRSAEFDRPVPPTLSAEQRLLVEQRAREARMSDRGAARRLADEADADTAATQGIASFVLRPAERRVEDPAEGAGISEAEAAAIVNAIQNGNLPAPVPTGPNLR